MLCQFMVKNFQCIKDEATLDMQAVNISEHGESLLVDADGEKFLPIAVIYGPNGGGKTTVIRALFALIGKVVMPVLAVESKVVSHARKYTSMEMVPFLFSKQTVNAPIEFELFFRTDIYEYQYNISLFKESVISEKLYKKAITGKRYTPVFVRTEGKIKLSGSLAKYDCKAVTNSLPLLSFLGITHKRNKIVQDVINWFEYSFMYVNYSAPNAEESILIASSGKPKELVLQMMKEMDLDLDEYDVEVDGDRAKRVKTYHKVGNELYSLDLHDESSGTIKLFDILPYIAESLVRGATIAIDEMDAKLHPALLKYIIHLFTDPESNRNGAQLIFTSHDLSTMNSETFRRDEIWFIAKNEEKASQLYSLIEFKNPDNRIERKDASFDKRYLEGRYGADPYLQKIIDWGEY